MGSRSITVGGSRPLMNLFTKHCTESDEYNGCEEVSRRRKRPDTESAAPSRLVPAAGVEPARYCYQRILSPSRLPIPSRRQNNFIQNSISYYRRFVKQ